MLNLLKKIVSPLLFALAGFCLFNNALAIGHVTVHQKTFSVNLSNIKALKRNVSPAGPKALAQCKEQYSALLGVPVRIHYRIDASERATATFETMKTQLHPAGLAREYDFLSNGVSVIPGSKLERIYFKMTDRFTQDYVALDFVNSDDPNTTCILSGSL